MTIQMEKTTIAACLLFAAILAYGIWFSGGGKVRASRIVIAGHEFRVELADTDKERERGLSGREGIAADAGMLFVFPEPVIVPFWMKDMEFPIDIIWIADGRVVGVVERATPDGGKKLFYPPRPIGYAFEVRAGTVAKFGIAPGAEVRVSD